MEIKLKDVNDDLTITRGGVSIKVFEVLQSLLPIPVEGDVQIFDDPECTKYATGVKNQGDKVYARVNVPWGFGEDWGASGSDGGIVCAGPSDEYPDDAYNIVVWADYSCNNYYFQPFTAGQVVELTCGEGIKGDDVTNYQKVFTKPTN